MTHHILTREWNSELQRKGLSHQVHGDIVEAVLHRHDALVEQCLETGEAPFALAAGFLAYHFEKLLWDLKLKRTD